MSLPNEFCIYLYYAQKTLLLFRQIRFKCGRLVRTQTRYRYHTKLANFAWLYFTYFIQHFVIKLCNSTIFKIVLLAVLINLALLEYVKIQSIMGIIHYVKRVKILELS